MLRLLDHLVGEREHLGGAMMAGIDLVHVPYRGDFMADLLGGRVQVCSVQWLSLLSTSETASCAASQ